MKSQRIIRTVILLAVIAVFGACVASPPENTANICSIFEERRSWYRAAKRAEERWRVPLEVNMAFINQESAFRARARPPRTRILWVIPWLRPSSAFGYPQALDGTWAEYRQKSGNRLASRSNFGDAIDFIGWYNANSVRLSGIARSNARDLYLAYHEGNGGFQRGTHRGKRWLLNAAANVQRQATAFSGQLAGCRRSLDRSWLSRVLGL